MVLIQDASELPASAGVYIIRNTANAKVYVGSSVNVRRRVRDHFRLAAQGRHHNPYFQRAFAKYGSAAFVCEAVQVLPEGSTAEDILGAEQRWLDSVQPSSADVGYNIHHTAKTPDGALIRLVPHPSTARLRKALEGRKRGVLTPEGRAARSVSSAAAWAAPGEKEYRAERLREIWATAARQAKVRSAHDATSPDQLDGMRRRLAEVRQRHEASRRAGVKEWWFQRNGPVQFSSEQEMCEYIAHEHATGRSARQIGTELGMAHNSVMRRLKDAGIPVSPRGSGRRNDKTRETALQKVGITDLLAHDAHVCALYDAGFSINAIRGEVGLSAWAIRATLVRGGRDIRSKAEAIRLRLCSNPAA